MVDLETLQNKQLKYIAQGALTNSKNRTCFVERAPTHALSGNGPYLKGSDRKDYIDFICGLGSVSIGYNEPSITSEVIKSLLSGVSHSLPTPIESQAAEFLLSEFLTSFEAVKYLKTGAEATSAAVRIARAATKRRWILTVGYHGWHDLWISTKQSPTGLAESFCIKEFEGLNELLSFLKDPALNGFYQSDIAAVIIEPIMLEHSAENTVKLQSLLDLCQSQGILTIFDEIVCGTRIPEVFISNTLKPDLVCIGKGIANGFPLSAVVGKAALMHETPYFVSSTFAGETASLVAHLQTLKYLKNNPPRYLYENANRIMSTIAARLSPWIELKGYGTRGYWNGQFDLVQQELLKSKVLIGKSWFMNYSHIEIEPLILSAVDDAVQSLGSAKLEGRSTKEAFKRV